MCFGNLTRWVCVFISNLLYSRDIFKMGILFRPLQSALPTLTKTQDWISHDCMSVGQKQNKQQKNQQNKTLHTQFIWIHEHTWTVEKWGVSVTAISHLIGRVYISRQDQTGFPTQWTEGSNTSPVFHHTTKVTCHLHHHCACLIWLTH